MRRTPLFVLLSLVVLVSALAIGRSPGTHAHEGSPEAMSAHPFVGRWNVDTDVQDPASPPELAIVTDDGTYLAMNFDVGPGVGSWEATGSTTANITIWFSQTLEDGSFGGFVVARAEAEVSPDSQSWTATYTVELVGTDGSASGQYGPGMASATRLSVEAMGEPIGTFEDLFGPLATPET